MKLKNIIGIPIIINGNNKVTNAIFLETPKILRIPSKKPTGNIKALLGSFILNNILERKYANETPANIDAVESAKLSLFL